MRRAEREITDSAEIDLILQEARVCRLGLACGRQPYVVPVSFAVCGGHLYFHSAAAGKKIDILKINPSVCFETDIEGGIICGASPCACSVAYKSVIGRGEAFFVHDNSEKAAILDLLMKKYAPEAGGGYSPRELDKVVVVGIRIEEITGKKYS